MWKIYENVHLCTAAVFVSYERYVAFGVKKSIDFSLSFILHYRYFHYANTPSKCLAYQEFNVGQERNQLK